MYTNETIRKKLRSTILTAVLVLLISTVFVAPVFAAAKLDNPISGDRTVMMATTGKYIPDIDNGIYSVSVQGAIGPYGEGTYTVATSSGHPVPVKNVLYGGVDHDPGSTYLTVRVYETGKEYVSTTSRPAPSPGYTVVALDDCSPVTTQSGNRIYTTWTTEEGLLITQIIAVEGSTLADSRVRATTCIANNNDTSNLSIGVRYVWDLMVGDEDGSWFAERHPNGDWIDTECEWVSPTFERYAATNDPNSSIFSVLGTSAGPGALVPPPTPPDMLQFAAWGSSSDGVFGHAFDFALTGLTLAGPDSDSAIAYYWGNNETNAITLNPSESASVTQYLHVIPPPSPPQQAVPALTLIGIAMLTGLLAFIGAGAIMRRR